MSSLIRDNLDIELESYIKLYVLLYADDTIILADTANELQEALNALSDYCIIWKMKVNIDKTKIIMFSKRKCKNYPDFILNGEKIELVDSYVYLGTTIKFNGKFQEAKKKQLLQAKRALAAVISQKEKLQLPLDIFFNLFDTMVLPILLYNCEVWGYEDFENLEIFYRAFLKNTLKLNKQTPNCMVYGESGRKPLHITIQLRMINFWTRIVTGDENKLVFHIYKLLRQMHVNGNYTSPWIGKVEDIFNNSGMTNIWLNPLNFNPLWIKKSLNLRLNDIFSQQWHSNIMEMNSCISYKLFKNELKFEKYLLNLDITERINLCKFRCRNSKIPVVVLGYAYLNIPYENRICTVCNQNEIGDEYHYVMRCHYFQHSREKYIENIFWINPSYIKFSKLFQSKDVGVLRNLAKFIKNINRNFK